MDKVKNSEACDLCGIEILFNRFVDGDKIICPSCLSEKFKKKTFSPSIWDEIKAVKS